jgi:subtilisin family serine protease
LKTNCAWRLALCLCGTVCALLGATAAAAVDEPARSPQILVMLHTAPPHFRPDVAYAGSYDSRIGRDARRRIAEALANRYRLSIVTNWPMPALGVDCFVMVASPNDSIGRIVDQLAQDPSVESVQALNVFNVLAYNDPLYPLQPSASVWHLADVHKVATGKRVKVAEIDTGVEISHPDLVGQIALARDFVDVQSDIAELHGTAVAGIIAARANDGIGIVGIAPDARLYALRACWQPQAGGPHAVCNTFTLAKALQFAIDENVQVINLSLGGPQDRLLGRLLDAALSRGITIVTAADSTLRDGGFPASHRGVLAVAADDVHDIRGSALLGPGTDIPTTVVGGKWGFVTGSSFAAAHVAGLVALLRELEPNLPAREMREALEARPVAGGAGERRVTVDACAAIARIGGTCACACAVVAESKSSPPP